MSDQVIRQIITTAGRRFSDVITTIERSAEREEARREAEHKLRMAQLDNTLQILNADHAARMAALDQREIAWSARIDELVTARMAEIVQPADGRSITIEDVAPMIEARIDNAILALPPAEPGRDGKDGKDGHDGKDADPIDMGVVHVLVNEEVSRAVGELPLPKDGKDGADGVNGTDGTSVRLEDVLPALVADAEARLATITGIPEALTKAAPQLMDWFVLRVLQAMPPVERGEDGKDGTSVTLEDVTPLVEEAVERAVASLPPPANGKDGRDGVDGTSVTLEDIQPMIERAVAQIELPVPVNGKDGADGKDGEPGLLPLAVEWTDEVHYKASVVVHNGATYQARKDTAKEPPHDDWVCLAARGDQGERGADMPIPNFRGGFKAGEQYERFDIVMHDGSSFIAVSDTPDPMRCPGEGWRLLASAGKRGVPGIQGVAGSIATVRVADDGLVTIVETSGKETSFDLYPLLSKIR